MELGAARERRRDTSAVEAALRRTDRRVILSRLLPPGEPIDSADVDQLYSTPRATWLRINLVLSVDGSVVGSDGTSNSLTGGADRKVLGAIRRAADVVLVGASSVRAEGYQLPKAAPLAVVTASGDLGGHSFADAEPGRLLVLCPPDAVAAVERSAPHAQIIKVDAPAGRIAPETIVSALRDRGYQSIVCEGGPALATQLLAAGLVDELCLSTSPVIAGTAHAPFGEAATSASLRPVSLRLTQLLMDEAGFQFARWAVDRG